MAQVTVLVERQQRVLAERVAQRQRVGLAGLEDRWVVRGSLLDERRIAESTTFLRIGLRGGEDIAVALAAAAHPPHRNAAARSAWASGGSRGPGGGKLTACLYRRRDPCGRDCPSSFWPSSSS
jgi:hypothetical protein